MTESFYNSYIYKAAAYGSAGRGNAVWGMRYPEKCFFLGKSSVFISGKSFHVFFKKTTLHRSVQHESRRCMMAQSLEILKFYSYRENNLDGLGRHNQRLMDSYSNANIDVGKSVNNVELIDISGTFRTRWQYAIDASGALYRSRKNGCAFMELLVSASKDFFESNGYVSGKPFCGVTECFFRDALAWAKKAIGFNGGTNIFSAIVFLDMSSPHLMISFIPVAEYQKKKGIVVEVCKNAFFSQRGGRASFSMIQDNFYECVGKKYGLGRGQKKEKTGRWHTSLKDVKKLVYDSLALEPETLFEKLEAFVSIPPKRLIEMSVATVVAARRLHEREALLDKREKELYNLEVQHE